MAVTVVHGICIEVMRKWKENSVDAIVCDPPYGLEFMGKEWDSFSEKEDQEGSKAQTDKWGKGITGSTLPRPAGKQNKSLRPFQQWCEEWGREALRILKPGGHILAFSGTRTYHRLACGLEDAGFVVRDSILWLYGSGFPKSLDVSKAIDKAVGAQREVIGERISAFGDTETSESKDGRNLWAKQATQTVSITGAPVTDDAKQWEGWGTALKPAHEPILVARKPIEGTIVQNIQEHGTGAINIGATRIKAGTNPVGRWPANVVLSHTPQCECVGTRAVYAGTGKADYTLTGNQGATPITKNVRSGAHYGDEGGKEVMENWVCPPNCPVRALDEQTADLRSGPLSADCYTKKDRDNDSIFAGNGTFQHAGYEGDAGGASRFFYCAKASRSEREAGLTGEANVVDRTGAAGQGMTGLKCRKCQKWKSSGNPCQCSEPDFEQTDFVRPKILNTHPTVKPIRLMEYLLTLVTPKGGVALDPFCGSGTTLVAAVNLGINCIGIEQDADYVKIAKARVEYAKNNRD